MPSMIHRRSHIWISHQACSNPKGMTLNHATVNSACCWHLQIDACASSQKSLPAPCIILLSRTLMQPELTVVSGLAGSTWALRQQPDLQSPRPQLHSHHIRDVSAHQQPPFQIAHDNGGFVAQSQQQQQQLPYPAPDFEDSIAGRQWLDAVKMAGLKGAAVVGQHSENGQRYQQSVMPGEAHMMVALFMPHPSTSCGECGCTRVACCNSTIKWDLPIAGQHA